MIQYNPTVSGSLTITGSLIVTGQISGTITASYVDYNSIVNKPTLVSGSSQLTSSLDAQYIISGSITNTAWDKVESKPAGIVSSSTQVKSLLPDGIVSGSIQISELGFVTGSYVTINEYNHLTQSFNIISASVVTIENDIDAGIYATTGSNTFVGTQIITGSTYISGDLVVQGSSSLENITASAVSIGTNIVYLNTDTPAVRFAGLSVFDSGSTGATGSLFYDSENERWLYQKSSGSLYSGGMLISGPRNLGALGDEVGMPNNKLIMGIGGDHISSSNIYHNGTDTAFAGNVEVTGSIKGQILSTNGVVSGSSQVSFAGIIDKPTLISGSSQVSFTGIVDKPTLVSGSSQITLSSTTGFGTYINQAVLTSSSPTFAGITTTGENLTSYTNAISTTNGGTGYGIHRVYANNSNVEAQMYAAADGVVQFGTYTNHNVYIKTNNSNKIMISTSGHITPTVNGTQDLGSASYRWSTIYTSDLSLNNGIGDWTIVEGEDDLFLYNNKKGKVYKFALTEVDPSVATPKKS